MAVAFRSKWHDRSLVSTITATEPAGAVEGDVLLYWLYTLSPVSSGLTGGWATLNTWVGAQPRYGYLYAITRGSSAPGYSVSTGTADYKEACVSCWSGSGGVGAASYNATHQLNPGNPDCPSVTTTAANSIVVALGQGNDATTVWTGPSGYSTVSDGSSVTGGGPDVAAFYKAVATLGTAEDPSAFSGCTINALHDVAEATVELLLARTPYNPWLQRGPVLAQ